VSLLNTIVLSASASCASAAPSLSTRQFYVSAASHLSGHVPYPRAGAGSKVFWFFSSEKNMLRLTTPIKRR
jgi:hypothetical protein